LCADLLAYESSVAYLPPFVLFLCLGGWGVGCAAAQVPDQAPWG